MIRSLVWFRRDLRLDDHIPLQTALAESDEVFACFVFDPAILHDLPRMDRRVEFIQRSLTELSVSWQAWGHERGGEAARIRLIFLHALPHKAIPALAAALNVAKVYAGRDEEPSAQVRDAAVANALEADGRRLVLLKDQVIFESDEVLTGEGRPFSVFTPFANAWQKRYLIHPSPVSQMDRATARGRPGEVPDGLVAPGLLRGVGAASPALFQLGFESVSEWPEGVSPGEAAGQLALRRFSGAAMDQYGVQRDFPAIAGTSRLSVHLRFGTVSIRQAIEAAQRLKSDGAAIWLKELIWREFFMGVLARRPDVVDHAWRREYDDLVWDDPPDAFEAWCEGRTGYPFVDAAMRELATTGFMHNRARMVVASFLTKDLGIDWRRGERFFARWLLDYDLAANNGGWQWSASTGCDAQPYFRIFNPTTQSRKFDPDGSYIRRWVPELASLSDRQIHQPPAMIAYPLPIVDHALARERTLARFSAVKRNE